MLSWLSQLNQLGRALINYGRLVGCAIRFIVSKQQWFVLYLFAHVLYKHGGHPIDAVEADQRRQA